MPGFTAFSFKVVSTRSRGNRLTTNGTVTFTAGGGGRRRTQQLLVLRQRGYKVGVRLKRGQRIARRGFRGDFGNVPLREDRAVTAELVRIFGQDAGEKWVGFVADPPLSIRPRRGRGNTISVDTRFTLTNFRSEPQFLPVVYAFGDQSFARHYILGVRVLTRRPPFAEVHVRAVH